MLKNKEKNRKSTDLFIFNDLDREGVILGLIPAKDCSSINVTL